MSVKYGSVIFAFFGTVAADVHENTPSFLIVPGVHAAAPSNPTIAPSIVTSVAPRLTAPSDTLIGCPPMTSPSFAITLNVRPCAAITASS